MILSVAVLTMIIAASDPTGLPCSPPGDYLQDTCVLISDHILTGASRTVWVGTLANYNGNLPYLYTCQADGTVLVVRTCNCDYCCTIIHGGVGPGGSCICT